MKYEVDGKTYTQADVDGMIARGETYGDRARHRASAPLSDAELARMTAEDPDLAMPENWQALAFKGLPTLPLSQENKQPVSLRLDPAVVDHFKAGGRGWQSRINAVLTHFVRNRQQEGR